MWGSGRTKQRAAQQRAVEEQRQHMSELRAELNGLLARAEQGEQEAIGVLFDLKGWDRIAQKWHPLTARDADLRDQMFRALRIGRQRQEHQERLGRLAGAYERIAAATMNREKVDSLPNYWYSFEWFTYGERDDIALERGYPTRGQALAELNEAVQALQEELLALARKGDARAMADLNALIYDTWTNESREYEGRFCGLRNVVRLQRPADWNRLVASLIANPTPRDFEHPRPGDAKPPNVKAGQLREWAHEALKMSDVVLSRYVLAHWDCGHQQAHTELTAPTIDRLTTFVAERRNPTGTYSVLHNK